MFILREGDIVTLTRDDWISRIEKSRESRKEEPKVEITAEIAVLDIANKAALARVHLYRDGKIVIYGFYVAL